MTTREFENLKAKADAGNAEAQVEVGIAYEKGEAPGGVNYDLCYKYYKMAADQGDSDGLNNLGVCYEHGYGIKQDYMEATRLFELSAENGNAYGAANAAHMYLAQLGVAFDAEKVVKYTIAGAKGGASKCLYNLGVWFLSGQFGMERNVERAQELIEEAAELGHPMAKDLLENTHGDLSNLHVINNPESYPEQSGNTADIDDAFNKAIEEQDGEELFRIGLAYHKGLSVKKDLAKAFECMQKAAELGFAHAFNDLGYYYEKGLGVEIDKQKAAESYKKGAEAGDSAAYNNFAQCLLVGCGIDKDEAKGIEYLTKSAEMGDSNAQYILGLCYQQGSYGIKVNHYKALDLFETAAKQNHADAALQAGLYYVLGEKVEKNLRKAIKWFEISAKNGNLDAANNLQIALKEQQDAQSSSGDGCMIPFLVGLGSLALAACSLL